jgi:hypothetical protein
LASVTYNRVTCFQFNFTRTYPGYWQPEVPMVN